MMSPGHCYYKYNIFPFPIMEPKRTMKGSHLACQKCQDGPISANPSTTMIWKKCIFPYHFFFLPIHIKTIWPLYFDVIRWFSNTQLWCIRVHSLPCPTSESIYTYFKTNYTLVPFQLNIAVFFWYWRK